MQPAQLLPALSDGFSYRGYFMLCIISSSSEKASRRNIHIFQNPEVQPAFAEGRVLNPPIVLGVQTHAQQVKLPAKMVYRNTSFSWKSWQIRCVQLALSQFCKWCLCGCTKRKKKQHERVGNVALPGPSAIGAVASSAALPCSRCDGPSTWFTHKLIISCLGFRSYLYYFNVYLPKISVATREIQRGMSRLQPCMGE